MKLEPYTEELRGCPVKGNAYPVLVLGIGNPLMGDDGAGVELAHRLQARSTDPEDVIIKRLDRAREECGEINKYDYLVVNDSVIAAVGEIISILTAEGCRVKNRSHLTQRIIARED